MVYHVMFLKAFRVRVLVRSLNLPMLRTEHNNALPRMLQRRCGRRTVQNEPPQERLIAEGTRDEVVRPRYPSTQSGARALPPVL